MDKRDSTTCCSFLQSMVSYSGLPLDLNVSSDRYCGLSVNRILYLIGSSISVEKIQTISNLLAALDVEYVNITGPLISYLICTYSGINGLDIFNIGSPSDRRLRFSSFMNLCNLSSDCIWYVSLSGWISLPAR